MRYPFSAVFLATLTLTLTALVMHPATAQNRYPVPDEPVFVTESPDLPRGNLHQIVNRLPRSPYPNAGEPLFLATNPNMAGVEQPGIPLAPPPAGVVQWHEADQHVGRLVTVEGKIVRTQNIGRITFLNFSNNWRGQFSIVVFEDAYAGFPSPPEKYLLNKTLHITGPVTIHRGRTNIEVRDASAIKVVNP
ncbi:MAG: hypothetical protein AAGI68_06740 [Planctomycetota bacterium]